LGVLIIGDPGRIDREKTWLRVTTDVMVAVITVTTVGSAVRLVVGLVSDSGFADAQQLLLIGAVVWLTNMIAFGLWYLGPRRRRRGGPRDPDEPGHTRIRVSRDDAPGACHRRLVPTVRRLPDVVVQHRHSLQSNGCVRGQAVGETAHDVRVSGVTCGCPTRHRPGNQRSWCPPSTRRSPAMPCRPTRKALCSP
jgi:hypothetical protein